MRKNLVLLSLTFLICGVLAQNTPRPMSVHFPPAAIAAFQKIDAQRIRAHVRFLSHDLLEGRGTGQRGGDIAAEYLATQFALDGLKPAGDNGTYLQKVPMVGITLAPEATFSLVPEFQIRVHAGTLSFFPNTPPTMKPSKSSQT